MSEIDDVFNSLETQGAKAATVIGEATGAHQKVVDAHLPGVIGATQGMELNARSGAAEIEQLMQELTPATAALTKADAHRTDLLGKPAFLTNAMTLLGQGEEFSVRRATAARDAAARKVSTTASQISAAKAATAARHEALRARAESGEALLEYSAENKESVIDAAMDIHSLGVSAANMLLQRREEARKTTLHEQEQTDLAVTTMDQTLLTRNMQQMGASGKDFTNVGGRIVSHQALKAEFQRRDKLRIELEQLAINLKRAEFESGTLDPLREKKALLGIETGEQTLENLEQTFALGEIQGRTAGLKETAAGLDIDLKEQQLAAGDREVFKDADEAIARAQGIELANLNLTNAAEERVAANHKAISGYLSVTQLKRGIGSGGFLTLNTPHGPQQMQIAPALLEAQLAAKLDARGRIAASVAGQDLSLLDLTVAIDTHNNSINSLATQTHAMFNGKVPIKVLDKMHAAGTYLTHINGVLMGGGAISAEFAQGAQKRLNTIQAESIEEAVGQFDGESEQKVARAFLQDIDPDQRASLTYLSKRMIMASLQGLPAGGPRNAGHRAGVRAVIGYITEKDAAFAADIENIDLENPAQMASFIQQTLGKTLAGGTKVSLDDPAMQAVYMQAAAIEFNGQMQERAFETAINVFNEVRAHHKTPDGITTPNPLAGFSLRNMDFDAQTGDVIGMRFSPAGTLERLSNLVDPLTGQTMDATIWSLMAKSPVFRSSLAERMKADTMDSSAFDAAIVGNDPLIALPELVDGIQQNVLNRSYSAQVYWKEVNDTAVKPGFAGSMRTQLFIRQMLNSPETLSDADMDKIANLPPLDVQAALKITESSAKSDKMVQGILKFLGLMSSEHAQQATAGRASGQTSIDRIRDAAGLTDASPANPTGIQAVLDPGGRKIVN